MPDRWRARFSKARQQSSRFFAGLLHRSDKHRDKHDDDEHDEQLDDDDEQPRVTFDPFHTEQLQRQRHSSYSPSSRAHFLSQLSPIEEQLSALLTVCTRPSSSTASSPSASTSSPLPPFFVLVDASGPRGRRLLRWLTAAADSSSSASSSPFSGVLAIASAHDVHVAFNGLVSLYKRQSSATSPHSPAPLRLALAGPDSLLSHLLPVYIAALTLSPALPIRVYPIPLYATSRSSAPSSSRVCAYLASVDNLYLSLFFSSAYQHAFDGASVEAEGAVVLDAIVRYAMDATVTVKLPLGEVNMESAATAAAHSQHGGARERERDENEPSHSHHFSQSTSSSPAIARLHPAPVQVPSPAAAELVSAAPSLLSPSLHLHAVSAPAHHMEHKAVDYGNGEEGESLTSTPLHRTIPPISVPGERKDERERTEAAHEREMKAAGRVTLPFVSEVALLSFSLPRPRTTSDSELHRPPAHLQQPSAAMRAADEQHGVVVHPPDEAQQQHHRMDSESERKGGEHKKGGSVLSSFNKALLSMTRTASGAEAARHTKNAMSSVQLPPASALSGSKSDSAKMARPSRRRNSDSQTHYRGESASLPVTHAATSSALSSIPADLLHAPLLNRRVSLSWFTSGKEKASRGSVDLTGGATSGAGGGKLKKSNVKGTFERLLVQRIVDEGSDIQHSKKTKEHKRSFMEQAMHSMHLPSAAALAAPSPAAASTAPALLAAPSSDHSTAAHTPKSASSPPTTLVPGLAANQLLLLARRRPPKEPSLLHRLRDDSSYLSKTVNKVIVSAPDHSAAASSTAAASSASSHVSGGGGELMDLGCLVDGVEVPAVSVVSVSAQVSGRVKSLAVQLFSVPSSLSV